MLHFPVLVFYIICSITYFHVTKHFPCVPGKHHSHKKRKDSLEGSLDRVLFAAELEFPKILVPRLSQHTSNVNTECAGKLEWSKQLYSLCCDQLLGALKHLNSIILVLFDNSSNITISPVLNTGGKYSCSCYSRQGDRWQSEKAN